MHPLAQVVTALRLLRTDRLSPQLTCTVLTSVAGACAGGMRPLFRLGAACDQGEALEQRGKEAAAAVEEAQRPVGPQQDRVELLCRRLEAVRGSWSQQNGRLLVPPRRSQLCRLN